MLLSTVKLLSINETFTAHPHKTAKMSSMCVFCVHLCMCWYWPNASTSWCNKTVLLHVNSNIRCLMHNVCWLILNTLNSSFGYKNESMRKCVFICCLIWTVKRVNNTDLNGYLAMSLSSLACGGNTKIHTSWHSVVITLITNITNARYKFGFSLKNMKG